MGDNGPYGAQAEALLEQALSETRDGIDAIPTVVEALAWLRAEAGECEPPESYAAPDEDDCICPPDLLARGGFKGRCPVHA
jgi:hypothetical protein